MTECPKNGSKLNITLPGPQPVEYWWDPANSSPSSIEEERGYDCGYLDLGTETPVSASSSSSFLETSGLVENWALRRPSSHLATSPITNRFKRYTVDRDCGICFEYAVVPCRTLCCGKIFCTEHLGDWLHGPKAEGRCPNCESACSLEGSTLSLASPTRSRLNSATQAIPGHFHTSPSPLVQHHHTLRSSQEHLLPQTAAEITTSRKNSSASSPTDSETITCSDYSVSTQNSKTIEEDDEQQRQQHHVHHIFPPEGHLSGSYALPWAAASRLISILMFLVFLYKLRS